MGCRPWPAQRPPLRPTLTRRPRSSSPTASWATARAATAWPSRGPAPGRYLAVEDGEVTRLVALHQAVTHVGRGFSADLRLEDQSVSRRHAVVVDDGDGARILDDRSANGTFVNGVRITDAQLRDRDVIRLGRVALVFRAVTG